MKSLLPAGALAGVLLAAPVSAAPTPTPEAPVHVLLPHLNDAAIQRELALKPEQVKALLAHRQEIWDERYRTPPKDHAAKSEEWKRKTAAVFAKVLDAGQFRRAGELAWQSVWPRPDPPSAVYPSFAPGRPADPTRVTAKFLAEHPELAATLDLSDDQKKLAAAKPPASYSLVVLLTPGQADKARKFLGPVGPTGSLAERDPRMDRANLLSNVGGFGGYVPGPLGLLRDREVKAELKITADQEQEFARLREPWADFGKLWREVGASELHKKADALLAETDKGLAAVFTPQQLARFRQLAVRDEHDSAFGKTTGSLIPNLAAELGVTLSQRWAFEAVRARHARAVAAIALADRDYDDAHVAIRATNREREKGFEAILSADQKAALKALAGDPLPGRERSDYGSRISGLDSGSTTRESSFGHYGDELAVLARNKSVRDELKLTADQVKGAQKAAQDAPRLTPAQGFGQPRPKLSPEEAAERRAARTKFIADALASILDADQAKRFRQVMMQQRHYSGVPNAPYAIPYGIPSAVTYPGVADAVKVTDEQKKWLIDGEHPADVLTGEQRKAIRDMLGERFTGDYATPSPNDRPATPRPSSAAADRERAAFLPHTPWEATTFTPEQVEGVVAAVNRYSVAVLEAEGDNPRRFREPPAEVENLLRKARSALRTDLIRALGSPPGNAPFLRIDQLRFQSAAAISLPKAFALPETALPKAFPLTEAAALKLTPAQAVRIADLEDEAGQIAELVTHARLTLDRRNAVLARLRDRLDERVLAVLTAEQRTKWAELTGDPYPGFTKPLLLHPPRGSSR